MSSKEATGVKQHHFVCIYYLEKGGGGSIFKEKRIYFFDTGVKVPLQVDL